MPITPEVFRYRFEQEVPMEEALASLLLSVYAAEGVHGQACVRMEVAFRADEDKRSLIVDARTEVGRTVACIFTNLLLREFGEDAFRLERIGVHRDADLLTEVGR